MLELIAKPFGLLMMWLYELTNNYLLAVVLFSLVVKLILLPFQMKSKKGMMRMTLLQPQMQELQKKHGANKAKYNEEVQKLYREENINPMSGCLWSLLPFPILIALYEAIRKPLTVMMGVSESLLKEGGAILNKLTELGFEAPKNAAYIQIQQAKFISEHFSEFEGLSDKLARINYNSFGLDLGSVPNWKIWTYDWSDPSLWGHALGLFAIPVVAAVLTWLTSYIAKKMNPTTTTTSNDPSAQATGSIMNAMFPIMTLWFAFMMPAALGIYWIANSVFGIIQDVWLTKRYSKIIAAEAEIRNAERKKKEAEIEAKRLEGERRRAEGGSVQNDNTSKRKQQIKKRQAQAEKTQEWERAQSGEEAVYEPSRVGNRKYARGRSYDPDRFAFNGVIGATSDTSEFDADLEAIEDKLLSAANADLPADADDLSEPSAEVIGTDETQGE